MRENEEEEDGGTGYGGDLPGELPRLFARAPRALQPSTAAAAPGPSIDGEAGATTSLTSAHRVAPVLVRRTEDKEDVQ